MLLTSKYEPRRTHEKPQTNAKNAYVCATRFAAFASMALTRDIAKVATTH